MSYSQKLRDPKWLCALDLLERRDRFGWLACMQVSEALQWKCGFIRRVLVKCNFAICDSACFISKHAVICVETSSGFAAQQRAPKRAPTD